MTESHNKLWDECLDSIYNYIKDRSTEEIEAEKTKKELVEMYVRIYECKPISSYNKDRIVSSIRSYFNDVKRTDKLLG